MSSEIKKDFIIIGICAAFYALSFLPFLSSFVFIICAVCALVSAREMISEGLGGIIHFDFGEDTLMLIAVLAAFLIGEYHEGAMVAILFSFGEELEDLAVERSEKSISALADIRPDTAEVVNGEITETFPAENIKIGTCIFVKVGERVPIDIEVKGAPAIADLSALTGESLPVTVNEGEILKAGAIVLASPVTGTTVCEYGDSAAARIIDMVKNASENKGDTEKFITRFSRIYTPVVVSVAGILLVATHYIGNLPFDQSVHRALVFLVSSCPCALVLSIPLAYFAGIGAASKAGILIKGSEFCEKLAKAENAVFDKTGTMTYGKLHVSEIRPVSGHTENEILYLAASAEQYSDHPVSGCIMEKAESIFNEFSKPEKINEIAGEGITAVIDDKNISCGNRKLFTDLGIEIPENINAGIYISENGIFIGSIDFEDTVRPETAVTVGKLHGMGIKNIMMLTGDRKESAEKVAEICGLDGFKASLMPEDKLTETEKIKKTGITIFTGDGINDAPVLAAADVGAAIGMGSDAAVEAADIVLMKGGISSLPDAISISRKIMRCVRQNIIFIMAVKIFVLVLGAFGYSPIWLAVFADVGVCLIALLWSLRMMKVRG